MPEHDFGLYVVYNSSTGAIAPLELFQQVMDDAIPAPPEPTVPVLDGYEARAAAIEGIYWGTYRSQTSFERAFDILAPATTVQSIAPGRIQLSLPKQSFTSDFVEVEPWVFRQVDGTLVGTLVFQPNSAGLVDRMIISRHPEQVWERGAWYTDPVLHQGILLVSLVLVLSVPLSSGWQRITARRHSGVLRETQAAPHYAHIGALVVTTLILLFLGGIGVSLSQAMQLVLYGPDLPFHILLSLGWLIGVGACVMLGFAIQSWRHRWWGLFSRVHYTLVALAALAFTAELAYWRLLIL